MMLVYFLRCTGSGRVKIGKTGCLAQRIPTIGDVCPFPLELVRTLEGNGGLERALHLHFADKRVHGEWFDLTDAEIQADFSALAAGSFTSHRRPRTDKLVAGLFAATRSFHNGWGSDANARDAQAIMENLVVRLSLGTGVRGRPCHTVEGALAQATGLPHSRIVQLRTGTAKPRTDYGDAVARLIGLRGPTPLSFAPNPDGEGAS